MYDTLISAIKDEDTLRLALLLRDPEVLYLLGIKLGKIHPLQCAIKQGNTQIIEMLIDAGADPNMKLRPGILETACEQENLEVIKLLLDKGANPNMYVGFTNAFTHICRFATLDVIKCLLSHESDLTNYREKSLSPFYAVCFQEDTTGMINLEAIEYLLVNHTQSVASVINLILFDACGTNANPALVKVLIKHGADVNCIFENHANTKLTPLMALMDCEDWDILSNLDILLKHGADVHRIDGFGHSILDRLENIRNPKVTSMFEDHLTR